MRITVGELRYLIRETLESRQELMRPAFEKLFKFLHANPEVIATERGVRRLNGHFNIKSPGQLPSANAVEDELVRFERIMDKIGYDEKNRDNVATAWANVDRKIEDLKLSLERENSKRNKDAPPEGKNVGQVPVRSSENRRSIGTEHQRRGEGIQGNS